MKFIRKYWFFFAALLVVILAAIFYPYSKDEAEAAVCQIVPEGTYRTSWDREYENSGLWRAAEDGKYHLRLVIENILPDVVDAEVITSDLIWVVVTNADEELLVWSPLDGEYSTPGKALVFPLSELNFEDFEYEYGLYVLPRAGFQLDFVLGSDALPTYFRWAKACDPSFRALVMMPGFLGGMRNFIALVNTGAAEFPVDNQ